MSTSTYKGRKIERRNLYIRIPEDRKLRLKELARESNMTMETYVSAVLEEAISSGDLFTFVKKQQEQTPAMAG